MEKDTLLVIMREMEVSEQRAADLCGISLSTFKSRLEGKTEFTLCEIELLSRALLLDKNQIEFIFFGQKVS